MRRSKRFTIIRIALAVAATAAIVPMTAQAKPMPGPTYWVNDSEPAAGIPYLSQGVGVDAAAFGTTMSPDDRRLARAEIAPGHQGVQIPYLSQGVGVTPAELGFAVSNSPDDRTYARPTPVDRPAVVTDGGSGIDLNPFAVTGFGLALLLAAGGMSLAIRHNRKTKLSPA